VRLLPRSGRNSRLPRQFDAGDEGLKVAGEIVSFQPDDRAAEVVHKADAGVPYQASVYFDPNSVIVEDVAPNSQVTVNGYQLVGPAVVIRQWTLRGVSICPYGADAGTSTQFTTANAADVSITVCQTLRGRCRDEGTANHRKHSRNHPRRRARR
jgi:hypothetical protein